MKGTNNIFSSASFLLFPPLIYFLVLPEREMEGTRVEGPDLHFQMPRRVLPNHQRSHAKMEAQLEHVRVAYTFYAGLAPTCMLQSVIGNKISASELSRKFIKSALLVGMLQLSQEGISKGGKASRQKKKLTRGTIRRKRAFLDRHPKRHGTKSGEREREREREGKKTLDLPPVSTGCLRNEDLMDKPAFKSEK